MIEFPETVSALPTSEPNIGEGCGNSHANSYFSPRHSMFSFSN